MSNRTPVPRCARAAGVAILACSLLTLAGCGLGLPGQDPTPQPTLIVWQTATATVTVEATPAGTPTPSPSASGTRTPSPTPTPTSKVTAKPPASSPTWGAVIDLLQRSDDAGKPIRESYSLIVKSASYNPRSKTASRTLTMLADKVAWNPEYSDQDNTVSPILNTTVKWEKVYGGDLLILVGAGNGYSQVPLAKFGKYIADTWKAPYRLPFTVYTVGDRPVALVEWLVP